MKKILALVSALFLLVGLGVNAQDVKAILKKMDNVMYLPKDMTGKTKIILIDKNGKKSTCEAIITQKDNDKRIFRFTAPSSQAGIAVLSLPNNVMYLYMPAFGKERRISSSVKSRNFAGTDFSYDDMESKPNSQKYIPKLLKTDANSYILELITISKKMLYSKIIMKVHKTNFYPISAEFYDKGNNKVKEGKSTYKKIGKYWNAQEMTMTDLKKKHTTIMTMSNVKYDQNISDEEFTVRKLKQ